MRPVIKTIALFFGLLTGSTALQAENIPPLVALDNQVQSLKKTVLEINRDLLILDEAARSPEKSRVVVFLGMDRMPRFDLASVELKVDGKIVSTRAYTVEETAALQRGAIHRLHLGVLNPGEHRLEAVFAGATPDDDQYRRKASLALKKEARAMRVMLNIFDPLQNESPEMTVKEIP